MYTWKDRVPGGTKSSSVTFVLVICDECKDRWPAPQKVAGNRVPAFLCAQSYIMPARHTSDDKKGKRVVSSSHQSSPDVTCGHELSDEIFCLRPVFVNS
jgi:hypothetical protein